MEHISSFSLSFSLPPRVGEWGGGGAGVGLDDIMLPVYSACGSDIGVLSGDSLLLWYFEPNEVVGVDNIRDHQRLSLMISGNM